MGNLIPRGLMKYQIVIYLRRNPQDAFDKVEESSWEGQSLVQIANSVLNVHVLLPRCRVSGLLK